jgi:RimJ/RimL family protein N-acetyltransferase|tara:strand:- start:1826 stop:2260 length:435 start_codon:yes stop_codon:yes gene_type:complete
MNFNLREIIYNDYPKLLEWVNDPDTRLNSINQGLVKIDEHIDYIKSILNSTTINQYILEIDGDGVGTIKDEILDGCIEISYSINPKYRGKKLGILMMQLYLYNRKGTFLCVVKQNNIPSIKMVERIGYKLDRVENNLCYYILKR